MASAQVASSGAHQGDCRERIGEGPIECTLFEWFLHDCRTEASERGTMLLALQARAALASLQGLGKSYVVVAMSRTLPD